MTNELNKQLLTYILPASIKRGDQSAFLGAYNDLHIKVFRFFLKRVHTEDSAKDLTQQTFIRLWQFRHTLSEEHTLDKQVFVIAHSLMVNHFAKESSRKKIIAMKPGQQETTCLPAESFELSNHVMAAINVLPPVRKKILVLKAFHDFSNREIAHHMKLSVKTVEDHVTKAFRRMKEVMMLMLLVVLYSLS